MLFFLVIILIWILVELFFFATHKRPLDDIEMQKLALKRRHKYIRYNYSFRPANSFPDKTFKSSMKPQGKLYPANIDLCSFPSYAANLLKSKKHEWVILAMVQDKRVTFFWANKGANNSSVSFNCELSDLIDFCHENGCQTIMRFHNHPNSNPNNQTCFLASEQDKISARSLSLIAIENGLNWLDFVCERGRFLQYFQAFSNVFFPETSNIEQIKNENGISEMSDYKLHRELGIFR